MFLTDAELQTLTGYRRPACQRRWLERNGIPHFVNALGKPVVRQDLRAVRDRPKVERVD